MITLSAFSWVPAFAQGLVRDLRVRWALEEAGLPYQVKLIVSKTTSDKPNHQRHLRSRFVSPSTRLKVR